MRVELQGPQRLSRTAEEGQPKKQVKHNQLQNLLRNICSKYSNLIGR